MPLKQEQNHREIFPYERALIQFTIHPSPDLVLQAIQRLKLNESCDKNRPTLLLSVWQPGQHSGKQLWEVQTPSHQGLKTQLSHLSTVQGKSYPKPDVKGGRTLLTQIPTMTHFCSLCLPAASKLLPLVSRQGSSGSPHSQERQILHMLDIQSCLRRYSPHAIIS